MSTRIFYFFCDVCGADTTTYEMHGACPYCHAHSPGFKLVAEVTGDAVKESVVRDVENRRAKWIAANRSSFVGDRRKKKLRRIF